jgi:WD40 repeat protein
MMPPASPCPSGDRLQSFLLGDLPEDEAGPVEEHLAACPDCTGTLEGLRAHDTFTEGVRAQAAAAGDPLDSVVASAIRLLHALPASVPADATAAGSAGDGSPPPDGSFGPTEEAQTFLAPPEAADEIGRLGGYRVLRVLGTGGMGIVLEGEDERLRRRVALKVMRPALAARSTARQRFLAEGRSAAQVRSDHVVTVYQVGEDRGVPFLAMEFLHGESLEARLKRGQRTAPAEVLRLARETATALAAAHARGLVHRDVKPANVWLEEGSGRVKILDFGLARAAEDESHLTQSGTILGTPSFMAPEQARAGKVDPRADLFSLGCVLYLLASGELPFKGISTMGVLMALATETPRPVGELAPHLPPPLAGLIMRLLAKNSADRPASAQAVLEELRAIEAGRPTDATDPLPAAVPPPSPPTTSHPTIPVPRPAVAPWRRWAVPAVAAAVLLGLGVGAWLYGAMLVRIVTDKGELVVEVDDPDVEVTVVQGGAKVVDHKKERTFVLTAKGGEVEFYDAETGVRLLTKEFTLERGRKTVVRAKQELAAARKPAEKPAVFALDGLDPAKIPAAERFAWQPKELVAVIGEHRGRYWGEVRQVAYSPDGKLVATAGSSGVILWDPQTLRQQTFLPGFVQAVAFSPDSKTLAVAGGDDTVRLWDVNGGELKERTVIPMPVGCLVFSPGGKTLAGGCGDGTVRLWDVAADKPKVQAVIKTGAVVIAFAPDGKTLATGSSDQDKTVRLWDLTAAEPKETAVLTAFTEGLIALAFSPDGKTLATGDWASKLRLWDVTGAKPNEKAVVTGAQGTFSLAFTPDGKTLACSNLPGGPPGLLDVTGPEPRVKATVKGDPNGRSALSPDGKTFVTCDGVALRLWDLTGDEPRERLKPQGPTVALTSLALTPDGKKLATGGGDGVARLWDLTGPAPGEGAWAVLRDLAGRLDSVAFSPDGKMLALGGADVLSLWNVTGDDVGERAVVKRWQGPHRLAFSADGKTLVCTSIAGDQWVVRLLDVTEAEPRERAVLKVDTLTGPLALAPDGKTLACARSSAADVVLWDLTGAEPKERVVLKPPVGHYGASALAWSPDGKTLAASFHNSGNPRFRTLLLWDLSGAEPREQCNFLTEHLPLASSLAFNPDGKTLVYAGSGGQLIFWDVVGHRNRQELGRDYTDSAGETVLWDALGKKHHKQRRMQLPGAALSLAFAPDGRHLVLGNANGTAYVLRLDTPAGPGQP